MTLDVAIEQLTAEMERSSADRPAQQVHMTRCAERQFAIAPEPAQHILFRGLSLRRGLAASAVNARGAFWFVTYQGALNAARFVDRLKQLMRHRKRTLTLILDSLPAHKGPPVRSYVDSLQGKLQLYYLPGYAPKLNPDELVWNPMKRTGTAKKPLRKGDRLQARIESDL